MRINNPKLLLSGAVVLVISIFLFLSSSSNNLAPATTPAAAFGATASSLPSTKPHVSYFTADSSMVKPGGEITLRWKVSNTDKVMLTGPYPFTEDNLPGDGNVTLTLPEVHNGTEDNRIEFHLGPSDGQGHWVGNSANLTVTVDTGIVFHSFTVTPTTAAFDQIVTITWNVTGAKSIKLAAFSDPQHGADMPDPIPDAQLPVGSYQYRIPYGTLAAYYFFLEAASADGWTVYGPAVTVSVPCPHTLLDWTPPVRGTENTCFFDAPKTVPAMLQPFEHGKMIWFAMNDHSYIIVLENNTWSGASVNEDWEGPTRSTRRPPDGLFAPGNVFGKTWDADDADLGWALQPPQSYSLTFQSGASSYDFATWWLSLPDGKFLVTDHFHWWIFALPQQPEVF